MLLLLLLFLFLFLSLAAESAELAEGWNAEIAVPGAAVVLQEPGTRSGLANQRAPTRSCGGGRVPDYSVPGPCSQALAPTVR